MNGMRIRLPKFWLVGIMAVALIFGSLTAIWTKDGLIETVPAFTNYPIHHMIGMKSPLSSHKLLPAPVWQVLFVISPLIVLSLVPSCPKLLGSSVFLLRKQQFLMPVKFTSVFVGRGYPQSGCSRILHNG